MQACDPKTGRMLPLSEDERSQRRWARGLESGRLDEYRAAIADTIKPLPIQAPKRNLWRDMFLLAAGLIMGYFLHG